jgi:hypothetical protein
MESHSRAPFFACDWTERVPVPAFFPDLRLSAKSAAKSVFGFPITAMTAITRALCGEGSPFVFRSLP